MDRGDLVRDISTKELGIILNVDQEEVLIFTGNGVTIKDKKENWEVVPYYPASSIPANFVELLREE